MSVWCACRTYVKYNMGIYLMHVRNMRMDCNLYGTHEYYRLDDT